MEFKPTIHQDQHILREYKTIVDQPEPDWSAELYYPNDLRIWKIYLDGPSGTPYENGKFQLSVTFPETFPFTPPNFRFYTRIFHPNIDFDGHLSIDILNQSKNYSPNVSIRSVLRDIISLLRSPDPVISLCPEAAFLFSENPQLFHDKAASWTAMYATNDEIISSRSSSPKSIENVCNDSYKRNLKFV
jgi:ubiquitin-protein ligase